LALRYYGPSGSIETISAQRILDDPEVAMGLHGKLVVIGATATGVGDRFSTPFDPVFPGVEVQATGIANLLDSRGLIRDPSVRTLDAAAALVLLIIAAICALRLPLAAGSLVFLLCLSSWLGAVFSSFGAGYWLAMALPLATSIPPFMGMLLFRQLLIGRQLRQLESARQELGRFQSPLLAQRIATDPSFLNQPAQTDGTILFVDLSGFSGASERLGPSATRDVLKRFHSGIVETVERNHGLVLDFMGDGAMAGFGLLADTPNAQAQALNCAFELVETVQDWIASARLPDMGVRVGVHCGPVVLSRLGHDRQQQIAVTGDCVNVASRLMEVAKAQASVIAASVTVVEHAQGYWLGMPRPNKIVETEIRGRVGRESVGLWRLDDCRAAVDQGQPNRDAPDLK
jgi:adenylate cyclase